MTVYMTPLVIIVSALNDLSPGVVSYTPRVWYTASPGDWYDDGRLEFEKTRHRVRWNIFRKNSLITTACITTNRSYKGDCYTGSTLRNRATAPAYVESLKGSGSGLGLGIGIGSSWSGWTRYIATDYCTNDRQEGSCRACRAFRPGRYLRGVVPNMRHAAAGGVAYNVPACGQVGGCFGI